MTLSSTVVRDNALLAVDLTNPDLTRDGKVAVPHGTIHLYRGCVLEDGVCHQRLRAHNFSAGEVSFELRFRLEADFADVFEVRGTPRSPPRETGAPRGALRRHRHRLPRPGRRLRRTRLRCRPGADQVLAKEVRFALGSGPARSARCSPSRSSAPRPDPPRGTRSASFGGLRHARQGAEQEALRRQRRRVHHLERASSTDRGSHGSPTSHAADPRPRKGSTPTPASPGSAPPFGRDGIITALQCSGSSRRWRAGVLSFLAATQATRSIAGRTPSRARSCTRRAHGEMAALGEIPFGRYYGSVDATPLFVMLAGAVLRAHRRPGAHRRAVAAPRGRARLDRQLRRPRWRRVRRVRAARRATGSSTRAGRTRTTRSSTPTAGWPRAPIALCEVQGYVYAAKRGAAADWRRALGDATARAELAGQAERLRARFEAASGATTSAPMPWRSTATSGPAGCGHPTPATACSAASPRPTAPRGWPSDCWPTTSFSGWGIRTVAAGRGPLQPDVVPQRLGLAARQRAGRAGIRPLRAEGRRALGAGAFLRRQPLLRAASPAGAVLRFSRRPGTGPTLYPVACSPQAWASGSPVMMLLGGPRARRRRAARAGIFGIRCFPASWTCCTSRGQGGRARVDLRVHRYADGAAGVDVVRRSGPANRSIYK